MSEEQIIKQVEEIELGRLLFDENNPRFGSEVGKVTNQTAILDLIVDEYGVDDVLSSLAVNGYFSAEPIIVREIEGSDKLTVVEGNRRLASCLILAKDPRAKNQAARFANIQKNIKAPIPGKIPVIKFHLHENEKGIISYLGVRHIAAAQPWDSYAKAAWVARVIESNGLSLEDVTSMIGDKSGTIPRMLEGYYFIDQLIQSGKFNPEDSYRRGRGSNTKYPFSWIYTLLGYPPASKFLGLPDIPQENPIPKDKIDDAAMVIDSMFGNSRKGLRPSIDDSRKIGNLASILADAEKVIYLTKGSTVAEIERKFMPVSNQVSTGLSESISSLAGILVTLSESPLKPEDAAKFVPMANKARNLARDVFDKLKAAADGVDDIEAK